MYLVFLLDIKLDGIKGGRKIKVSSYSWILYIGFLTLIIVPQKTFAPRCVYHIALSSS